MTMFVPELIVTGVPGTVGTTKIVMLAPDPMLDGLEIPWLFVEYTTT
jgi:hypothetical protein